MAGRASSADGILARQALTETGAWMTLDGLCCFIHSRASAVAALDARSAAICFLASPAPRQALGLGVMPAHA